MTNKTEITKPENTAVAVPTVNFEDDANAGFEGAVKESFAIPYLTILQSLSPQCKKSDGAYIKGAEEGHLFNSATNALFTGPVQFVPAAYTLTYVEWRLRESGGGFRGEHDVITGKELQEECDRDDKGRDILPNGNQLNPTHNFFGFLLAEGSAPQQVAISMTSSQIKVAKKWMTLMRGQMAKRADGTYFTVPMFANIYHLNSESQSNEKGAWMGWNVSLHRALNLKSSEEVALYTSAKAFKDSILRGDIKVAPREEEVIGDDVPF